MESSKKVLLIIIDALASKTVVPAMQAGRLPTLAKLADAGQLKDCTAVFPSITPAATASIATGCYPCEHGIAGAYWWDAENNSAAFFGADLWVILNEGPGEYFRNFMVTLNEKYLQADPIFQEAERYDKTCAVINFMWFRGNRDHNVNAPWLVQLLANSGVPEAVHGPATLALADFVQPQMPGSDQTVNISSNGISQRYGFYDDITARYLNKLLSSTPFPDLTVAYFPNNDFDSHEVGPDKALPAVEGVDQHLAEFFEQHGGLDEFLQENVVVVCGDHSQSHTFSDSSDRDICLDSVLEGFSVNKAGTPWTDDHEVLPCPNLRAAQIYLHPQMSQSQRQKLVERLLQERRIDQIRLRDSTSSEDVFHIMTADRGQLRFVRATTHGRLDGRDDYGNAWSWTGALETIDAEVIDGRLHYGDYPNALERVACGFADNSASLWLTARLGCEFKTPETKTSPGGSHGSLHRLDSISPLIVAGAPDTVFVPDAPRTVDIVPICRQILGLPTAPSVATAH
jgi:predicted AlkP superfamily pyrophosphatase or phosphodiesterase